VTWQVAKRGMLPGAGQWPGWFGPLANTRSSGERRVSTNLTLQWFGPPGNEDTPDRHYDPMSPVYRDGVVLCGGKRTSNSLMAMDAYNGTILWKTNIASSVRELMSHNAGFFFAGEQHVFSVNKEKCLKMDRLTGQKLAEYTGPLSGYDWGYAGSFGNYLLGTQQGTNVDIIASGWGQVNTCTPYSRPAMSKNLFLVDLTSGERLWTRSNGLILNTTITVGSNMVYFVESGNSFAVTNTSGWMDLRDFMASNAMGYAKMVALDKYTGLEQWVKPLDPKTTNVQYAMYLAWGEGVLLSTRTYHDNTEYSGYETEAMDPSTGATRWSHWEPSVQVGLYCPLPNSKNAWFTPPSLFGGKAYYRIAHGMSKGTGTSGRTTAKLLRYQLDTGSFSNVFLKGEGRCAPQIASRNLLYGRQDYMSASFDPTALQYTDLTRQSRPSCWGSILPIGGLVLQLEAGTDCTCGRSIQVSLAMAPTDGFLFNSAPVVSNQNQNISANTPVSLVLQGSDADNDPLTFLTNTVTIHGSLTGFNPATGAISYTPHHGYLGTDTFTFGVSDGITNSPSAVVSLIISMTDTDIDGLPDNWETFYFGTPASCDPEVDSDGDGFTNRQEYQANTNPKNASSALKILGITPMAGGYRVNFTTSSNVFYQVERCDDLATTNCWTLIADHVPGTGGGVEIEDLSVGAASQRFYRAKLLPP